MSNFVDLSGWNADASKIDWLQYTHWSTMGDGLSRICFKASEGVGFEDNNFHSYRLAAIEQRIDQLIMYHFCRPDINTASAEAHWFGEVSSGLRPQDILMVDVERYKASPSSAWVWDFVNVLRGLTGRFPIIYASDSYVRSMLQLEALNQCELILANWTFNADSRPPCPAPWKHYTYLQYTDRAHVPGIPGDVDADVYVGGAAIKQPVPPPPPPPKKKGEPLPQRLYTVQEWPAKGSSLWSIAEIEYNNALKWHDIYVANEQEIGPDPNKLRAGMVLKIP